MLWATREAVEEEEGPVETSVLLQDLNPVGTPRKSEGTFDIDIQHVLFRDV